MEEQQTPEGGWIRLGWSSFKRLLGVVANDRALLFVVVSLLVVDLFWIVYFAVGRTLYDMDSYARLYYHKELLITTDGGVPELFTYAKTVALVFLLVRLTRLTREPIYGVLMAMYAIVVLDDALEIHETWGRELVGILDIPRGILGLRARDVGEVITWLGIGAVVGPLLLFGLLRSSRRARGNGLAILIAFGALLFCAMFVDQLYKPFSDLFFGANVILDSVEDGGEMLAISLALALAMGALRETSQGR